MQVRLLDSGALSPALNMGTDEAVLEAAAGGLAEPTLRFYSWKPRAVSIGCFQSLSEELDLDSCREHGVEWIRRITGGGAVFHDDEITYSIVIPRGNPLFVGDILESYRFLCSGLVTGFARLGVKAEFAPINDIVSGGKKVSGNAQTRKRGCILQHGTILLGVDVETMFELLKVPAEKLKGKLIEDAKARVTSLKDILHREVGYSEAAAAFRTGFAEALSVDLVPGTLTDLEQTRALEYASAKYADETWNAKR